LADWQDYKHYFHLFFHEKKLTYRTARKAINFKASATIFTEATKLNKKHLMNDR